MVRKWQSSQSSQSVASFGNEMGKRWEDKAKERESVTVQYT